MGLRGWEVGVVLNKIADSIMFFNKKKRYKSNYLLYLKSRLLNIHSSSPILGRRLEI